MRTFLDTLFDLIFPQSEEADLVGKISPDEASRLFRIISTPVGYALSSYHDPVVRALIHEAKFHANQKAWEILHLLVCRFLEKAVSLPDIIIPIPLSARRLRMRGYNQVERVLRDSALPHNIPVVSSLLVRTRDTRPQTDLTKEERLQNVRGVFAVTEPPEIRDRHIFLFDDVSTTGSTLREAREALLSASPKSVTCVALAH